MIKRLTITALLLAACTPGEDSDTTRVTADMIVDGDTVRMDGPNVRLTGEGDRPFDTPETFRPGCEYEARLGAEATAYVRNLMPGRVEIIERGGGGFGRDLGVLRGSDGRDVGAALVEAGLARWSMNYEWCADD